MAFGASEDKGMSKFGLLLTVLAALMTAAANLCLQKGVRQSVQFTEGVFWNFISLFGSVSFVVGGLLYVLSMLAWLKILAMEPVGLAYPVLVGISFVLLIPGAAIFAHEPISLKVIFGIILILAGITVVARA